jgi:hypothetical protein
VFTQFHTPASKRYPPITYYCTGILILDHSYPVENLTNWKVSETKALEHLKSWHFFLNQQLNLIISQRDMSGPRLGALSNNRWSVGIFKCISWLNGPFFGGDDNEISERESRPISWHQYCLSAGQHSFCLHTYCTVYAEKRGINKRCRTSSIPRTSCQSF